MSISLPEIEKAMEIARSERDRYQQQLDDLEFVKSVFINGTLAEKRLFSIISRMTIDNIKRLTKEIQGSIPKY